MRYINEHCTVHRRAELLGALFGLCLVRRPGQESTAPIRKEPAYKGQAEILLARLLAPKRNIAPG